MSWPEFKEALLKLPILGQPVTIERLGVILDEKRFLETHIRVIDNYPQVSPRTEANNRARLIVAKPHYDRLMAYYLLKTEL